MTLVVEGLVGFGALLVALVSPVLDERERAGVAALVRGRLAFEYNPDQPRDEQGRWGEGGPAGAKEGEAKSTQEDPRPGGQLRELVPPVSLLGQPITSPGVYAVQTNDGNQVRLFVNADVPKGQTPSEDQIRQALSTVADLHERDPVSNSPPSISVVSRDNSHVEPGTLAFTTKGVNGINLVGKSAWTAGSKGLMEAGRTKADQGRYIVAHEYGHLRDSHFSSGANRVAMARSVSALPQGGGMSRYGSSNPHEAYAEAYAQHVMGGGGAQPAAVTAYAGAFGWS